MLYSLQGHYFNPIIAIFLTGSARLILSIAEYIAEENGYYAYCDTDSMFVKPERVKDIQDFFRPLNPYSIDTEMFKIETDDDKNPLDNVMFYSISAKEYCLYDILIFYEFLNPPLHEWSFNKKQENVKIRIYAF